jgi:hypothetical protein
LWAYYKYSTVHLAAAPGAAQEYTWGNLALRFIRCKTCGCVLCWRRVKSTPESEMSVNARSFDPDQLGAVRIRRLDGAVSWKYLDP